MVEATAGELSPIVTGLVYCSVIDGCQEVHELRRASEWTAALSEWCDRQPGLVPFTGTCLIHRAELMQLHGQWRAALDEARLAGERFAQRSNDAAAGQALYRQGEILRLQGNLAGAERGSSRPRSRSRSLSATASARARRPPSWTGSPRAAAARCSARRRRRHSARSVSPTAIHAPP
jgi:hypothetical protein